MEINVDVVRGYYDEVHGPSFATPVIDHSADVINGAAKLCFDLERMVDDTSNVNLIGYRKTQQIFTQCYNHFIADDEFKVNLNFVDEDDIISSKEEVGNVDVGHIYLRAPLSDLTKVPVGFGIYLRLFAPQRGLTIMEVFPRNMVYMINTETFAADQVIRHLISVPHPVQPAQVMVVPYFDRSCIRVVQYQAKERDQYYYKDTASLVPWYEHPHARAVIVG